MCAKISYSALIESPRRRHQVTSTSADRRGYIASSGDMRPMLMGSIISGA
jgi:hypothetical protein